MHGQPIILQLSICLYILYPHIVAHNYFGEHIWASEHTRHTRDARHKLALGLSYYMCVVSTVTVAISNNMLKLIGLQWKSC